MKFRHEWKHEINKGDYYELRGRLSSIAYPDKNGINGRYIVRSLYFDDLNDTALMEKINGVSKREKFRIRYYDAVGIILAAGFLPLAVIGSVVIGIVLLVFVNKKSHLNPYMVVVSCADYEAEMAVRDFLAKQVQKSVIKSKTAQKHSIELNIEVRMKDENTDFINILSEMKGVNSAVLVSYNGDYMG